MRQTSPEHAAHSDPYREIAELYDLEHDHFSDDLPMYQQLVDMVGDPVLELACGSGRILSALVSPGRRLTGVDSSEAMLNRARERFAHCPSVPLLQLTSMTEPAIPSGTFGVVIIGLSSLHHLTDAGDQFAALQASYTALDPRGMLILDLLNPISALTTGDDGVVRQAAQLTTAAGERVTKFTLSHVDPVEQTIDSTIWYDRQSYTGTLFRTTTSMNFRVVHRSELDLMLRIVGFTGSQVYGSYDLDPFEGDSPRLIVMAEKTP